MSSPSGRRRPLSTSDFEPLLQSDRKEFSEKPKPPPKPKATKPQLLKSNSLSGSYFEPFGSTGSVGYSLSSIHKNKKASSSSSTKHDACDKITNEAHKPLFSSKGNSGPPIESLPAKFRLSFEQRNRSGSVHSGILVSEGVTRRPPPAIPSNATKRISNPFPSVSLPSVSSVVDNGSSISSAKSISGEKEVIAGSPTSSVSSLPSPSSVQSPRPLKPVTFAQPPPRELEYIDREHPRSAFQYLEKFRQRGELCDAILLVSGKELKAHRVVLAACSQYFESMFIGEFAEPLNEPIVIEEISDDTLQVMVDFAYTSRIVLTEKNIYSIFEAADLLQFTGIRAACFKFFKQQINKSNCIRTWLFARSHNCTELVDASLKYIDSNFLEIAKGREFLDLDQPDVVVDITSREDIAITSEEQVYEAVLFWAKSKLDKRKKYLLDVFRSIRFSSISKDYLMHIVDNETLIQEDPDVLQLVSGRQI